MPTGTTTTAAAAATAPRPRHPIFTKAEKAQIRTRLLIGAGLFQLLSIALIIGLNAGGTRVGNGGILASETYLLAWQYSLPIDPPRNEHVIVPKTFTLYYYLNSFCVADGYATDGPASTPPKGPSAVVARTAATDFSYRQLDDLFWHSWLPRRYACNLSSAGFVPGDYPLGAPLPDGLVPLLLPGDSDPPDSDTTTTNTTTPPQERCEYTPPARTRTPAHNPPFGAVSFAMFLVSTLLLTAIWAWHLAPLLSPHRSRPPPPAPHESKVRTLLLAVHLAATSLSLAAAALLSTGVYAVAAHTPDRPAGVAPVARNFTGLAVLWCAAACGAAGCVAYAAAAALWRGMRPGGEGGGGGSGGGAAGPARGVRTLAAWRHSLPTYRPRHAAPGDEDADADAEELPPYQREDPMGRPPGIDSVVGGGVRAAAPAAAECGGANGAPPMTSVGGGAASRGGSAGGSAAGRQTPSPEYQETVPASPARLGSAGGLGGGDGDRDGVVGLSVPGTPRASLRRQSARLSALGSGGAVGGALGDDDGAQAGPGSARGSPDGPETPRPPGSLHSRTSLIGAETAESLGEEEEGLPVQRPGTSGSRGSRLAEHDSGTTDASHYHYAEGILSG